MIFGNAAWGLRETPLEEQLRITKDMGLKVLELGIANAPADVSMDVTDEELVKIKGLAAAYGVDIMCAATGNDFTVSAEDVGKVKRVVDICEKLGIRYLRIFAGFTALAEVTEAMHQRMLDALRVVCEYAEEKGVVPVIETHGGVNGFADGVEHFHSTTTDMESLRRMASSLPDNAKICFDPANLYAVGHTNPESFYVEFKDRIGYAHFKDFAKLPSGHLRPSYCGDSDMDWTAILAVMSDFEGPALFEYENVEDVEEGLKKSYAYIKMMEKQEENQ
ncbi:MAG: sugar phosphate isomerase/epimerase [Lachnospiraceae bacterium]|nr:sugar phosphate isomerase/epimerase [Lachnospiraceae bacterium]